MIHVSLGLKGPDDEDAERGALSHPEPSSTRVHMFMAHACGMTMDSPYKSQQDHGVFQILLSEDSCWQNDRGLIYFGQGARHFVES